jgi:hypothetical protein
MGTVFADIGRKSASWPGVSREHKAPVTGSSGLLPAAGGTAVTGTGIPPALPVLPALRELLPRGGLARGSVVAAAEFGLLCLALAAGASADGAWCAMAGVPEAGVVAAAGLGLVPERTLLVPDPGTGWPQVVASLLDGCELVLLRPPGHVPAQIRQRLEATLRRGRGVLVVAGDWPGAQVRLRVLRQRWTGLGDGHGRLRACCAEVMADGRGEAAAGRTRWLWLPAEDGRVTPADPADLPAGLPLDPPTPLDLPTRLNPSARLNPPGHLAAPALHAVRAG